MLFIPFFIDSWFSFWWPNLFRIYMQVFPGIFLLHIRGKSYGNSIFNQSTESTVSQIYAEHFVLKLFPSSQHKLRWAKNKRMDKRMDALTEWTYVAILLLF